jgi:TRAP-type mannitol/chloroaromatic compound transport system substrate-binding protein
LQAILMAATEVMNQAVIDEITAGNSESMKVLVEREGVQLRKLPDDVLRELKRISQEVVEELAAQDETAGRVYESYKSFQDTMLDYKLVSEEAFDDARRL